MVVGQTPICLCDVAFCYAFIFAGNFDFDPLVNWAHLRLGLERLSLQKPLSSETSICFNWP